MSTPKDIERAIEIIEDNDYSKLDLLHHIRSMRRAHSNNDHTFGLKISFLLVVLEEKGII
jgi:hypothetical protein